MDNPDEQDVAAYPDERSDTTEPHALLSTTLQMITKAMNIKLIFCPKINSLRAFLSTQLITPASTSGKPVLAVLDLVALHYGTAEFSVQGLSRTLALLVETAGQCGRHLLLNECEDPYDVDDPYRGPRIWGIQIPLLNGSVKLAGEGTKWAGRTITIKRVAGRWFYFEKRKVIEKSTLSS